MNRKKLITFLVAGALIFSSGSFVATKSNAADTLDIEKTAIGAINNSVTVKTFSKQTEYVQKQYDNIRAAAQMAIAKGITNVNLIIYSPIAAENMLNQYVTNEAVNNNSVIMDAYTKYISLLKANYSVDIQSRLNNNLQKANKEAKLQLSNGLISKNEARLIEINYLKSKEQLNSLEKGLNSAYMAINLIMGEDISKEYSKLIDNNIVPSKNLKSLDEYVEYALANRGEIVNTESSLNGKKKEFEYDKATFHTDYTFYIQKRQYELDRAESDLDEAKVKVQLEITNGYKTLEGYMKALESEQINYDTAVSDYEGRKIRYDNGMITLSQLQQAEIAKTQAEISLKNAELDAWLEQVKMNNATGIGPGLK